MANWRIEVIWLRYCLLLVSVSQQLFQRCFAETSNPCDGIDSDDVRRITYGTSTFLDCQTDPKYPGVQGGTYMWVQNGTELLPEQKPHLSVDDAMLDIEFVESDREGVYGCTYQQTVDFHSRVDGIPVPMCMIVRGVPVFQDCMNLTAEHCNVAESPESFNADGDLNIQVSVIYVGAGPSGAMFDVIGISVAKDGVGVLMLCSTVPPISSDSQFSCFSLDDTVTGRICGNITIDHESFVNASFVINSTTVDDAGEYSVRVTGYDQTISIVNSISTDTVTARITTTMTLSATMNVDSQISTSLVNIPGTTSANIIMPTTETSRIVPTPTYSDSTVTASSGGSGASTDREDVIIIVVVVAGTVILVLFLGIVAVCLLILRGMCPKLKKQLMENVRLLQMKPNGQDNLTIITDGTMMQNSKEYHQPGIELPPEKNSSSFNV